MDGFLKDSILMENFMAGEQWYHLREKSFIKEISKMVSFKKVAKYTLIRCFHTYFQNKKLHSGFKSLSSFQINSKKA